MSHNLQSDEPQQYIPQPSTSGYNEAAGDKQGIHRVRTRFNL